MDIDAIWSIMLFLAFIALQAVLSGFLSALKDSQVETDLEEDTNEDAQRAIDAQRISEMLQKMRPTGLWHCATDVAQAGIAVLFGMTAINSAASLLSTLSGLSRVGAFVIFMAFSISLFVLFGKLIPRRFAKQNPLRVIFRTWRMVWVMCILVMIPAFFAQVFATALLKLVGITYDKEEENVTEEEIITMVNEGHEQGVLEKDAAEMITNIFEYGDKKAEDIMTHRVAIHFIRADETLREALHEIAGANNSRFPVCGEDLDDILGVLHMKEAIIALEDPKNIDRKLSEIKDLLQEPVFVSQTKNIDDLLHQMQKQKNHMVIVLDEYGQTSGLITMEDILEEIVGNIMDEYDEDEEFIRRLEDGSFIMSGMTPLSDVCKLLDLSLMEEESEEFDTLSGYIIYRLDHIPTSQEHETITEGAYSFEVISAQKGTIQSVRVKKVSQKTEIEE